MKHFDPMGTDTQVYYYDGNYYYPQNKKPNMYGCRNINCFDRNPCSPECAALEGLFYNPNYRQYLNKQIEKRSVKLNHYSIEVCYTFNCFTEDTLILTEDGYKKIKDITEDDYVYAENTETGERGFKKVTQTFRNKTSTLVYITVNGDVIESTEGHPFFIVNANADREFVWFKDGNGAIVDSSNNWIYARNLRKGDVVKLADGTTAEIESVEIKQLDKPVKTYNFEVEDWHTYFVGENCVLVHNASYGAGQAPSSAGANSSYSQIGVGGSITSTTYYNAYGQPSVRFDYAGRPHNGMLPHMHVYSYNQYGQPNGMWTYGIH